MKWPHKEISCWLLLSPLITVLMIMPRDYRVETSRNVEMNTNFNLTSDNLDTGIVWIYGTPNQLRGTAWGQSVEAMGQPGGAGGCGGGDRQEAEEENRFTKTKLIIY